MANLYRDAAAKRWPDATIQKGRGQFAVYSSCPPMATVILYDMRPEAVKAKGVIDEAVCGDQCRGPGEHKVIDLSIPEQNPESLKSPLAPASRRCYKDAG